MNNPAVQQMSTFGGRGPSVHEITHHFRADSRSIASNVIRKLQCTLQCLLVRITELGEQISEQSMLSRIHTTGGRQMQRFRVPDESR